MVSEDSPTIILISGTSSGIGQALVNYYLDNGAIVLGISRSMVELGSPNYHHFLCDVTSPDSVQQFFKDLRSKFPKIEVFINNAGDLKVCSSLLLPATSAKRMIDTNFFGAFLMMRECAKLMLKEKRGRIINISSMAEILEPVGDAVYSASKAASTSLTNSLAKEFAPYGITCNTLAITFIPTPMSLTINQEVMSKTISELPIPRSATIEDVTNIIDFFIRPESANISAQFIALGGLHH